ncbi:MAG: MBL fold metallo-hydrolase [Acholeplasmataceae bacterium]
MKITCLVADETLKDRFEAEHGLSFYIETSRHRILFDVGQTDLFSRNARRLGIDLSLVDTVIISHGHYDHGGGLEHFFSINDRAIIYINRKAKGAFYSQRKEGMAYVGLDADVLDNERIRFLDDDLAIDSELIVFKELVSNDLFPVANRYLFERKDNAYVPDRFEHEQNLLITEDQDSALFAGCGHRGIVNIVDTARKHLKDRPLKVVFAGFHTANRPGARTSPKTIDRIAQRLDDGRTLYFTGHCTGDSYPEFKRRMDSSIRKFYPGTSLYVAGKRMILS